MSTHREPKVKERTILWAKKVLAAKGSYVILDTETTGLKRNDVVLEIAIIDLDGNELFNSKIRPTKRKKISEDAIAIHGIKMADLKDAPTFAEIKAKLEEIIGNKTVIIYNTEYDKKIIDQTCKQDECSYFKMRNECAMIPYSEFVGRWSEYHHNYTFQRLPGGDHSAIGDCRATLKAIQKMANTPLTVLEESKATSQKRKEVKPPIYKINTSKGKKWWEFWK
jgi:DNA polymerase III subunit epsilon